MSMVVFMLWYWKCTVAIKTEWPAKPKLFIIRLLKKYLLTPAVRSYSWACGEVFFVFFNYKYNRKALRGKQGRNLTRFPFKRRTPSTVGEDKLELGTLCRYKEPQSFREKGWWFGLEVCQVDIERIIGIPWRYYKFDSKLKQILQ